MPARSRTTIKGIALHPEQPQHQSNVSGYSGQSRIQSQKRGSCFLPQRGKHTGIFPTGEPSAHCCRGLPKDILRQHVHPSVWFCYSPK